jgi:hypothetical protein
LPCICFDNVQACHTISKLQPLQRRRGGKIGLASEVKKYLTSMKLVKKATHRALKGMQNNRTFSASQEDHETNNMCHVKIG